MIIFYEKKTGRVVGTIDGRIHPSEHLQMWIGSKVDNGRLVVQWKPTGDHHEPDHPQKDLFIALDQKPMDVYKYKIQQQGRRLPPLLIENTV